MKKIFLFGYYGFQNTGDDAILEAIIQQIKTVVPDASLTVLSYNVKDTLAKYDVSAVSRNNFTQVIKAIKTSDLVISGGGSILQDVTSSRSLLYYSAIIFLAKKMGKKLMFYGNGFGPINRYINRKIVKAIVNRVDVITVRDYESKEYMQSLGIKKEISITADIAFGLKKAQAEEIEKIMQKEEMDNIDRWVGISVRPWGKGITHKEIIAKTADYLLDRNYGVVFLPMQYPNDVTISREIKALMKGTPKIIESQYRPSEIMGIIGKMDLLLGMRLHSLIFATMVGVPMVGLEYDVKIKNFLKIVKQKNGGIIEKLDIIHLWATIDGVLKQRDQHINMLEESKINLHKKMEMNMEIFNSFIEEGVEI